MRLFDILTAVLAALGLVALGVYVFLQMPQIEDGVEARLGAQAQRALSTGGSGWVNVEMDGQVARLSGVAPSDTAAADVSERVRRAAGGGGIVLGGVTRVETDFTVAEPISPYVFTAVRTEDDRLILEGHVPDEAAQARVLEAASDAGAAAVIDRLETGYGAPDERFASVVLDAVSHLARMKTGRAVLTDTQLKLSGTAMDTAAREEISAAVKALDAPYSGQSNLRAPGYWFARHLPEGLLLKGRVNSPSDRDEITAIARANYEGEVLDRMEVAADGPQGWSDGVRRALPHFARFRSGRMTFAPDEGLFRFEGEAAGSTLAFLAEDMAEYDGPFAVDIGARKADIEIGEISGIDFESEPRAACETAFATVLENNSVNFASGEAVITRDSGATLDKLMAVARRCSGQLVFEVGGHTDSAGDRDYNKYLSQQRARAVADYLTDRGLAGDRVNAVGYGPDRPVADNRTREGRAANRRIEVKVLERSE
ncbi:MAG: OmpA family protein [Alphaproteobacteria bacterium]|jgi:OOP family OmpA-OmpF porin|nr:OmpA family protein [Alphaproteobacteria bacterium]